MKVSACCWAGPANEQGICPRCKEHCDWVDEDDETGEEGQDRKNYTDTQDRESYVVDAECAR
jgi:hypothetical protein